MQLKVYYEDKDILVCLKKAGIATQTCDLRQQDMVTLVKKYLVQQKGSERDPYLGLIHRLDQPVSGLLVFAKNKCSAARLSRQLSGEEAHKEYFALCAGTFSESEGRLVHYLKKDRMTRLAQVTDGQDIQGKRAELLYQVKTRQEECTLLRIQLITGRFHQIRAQLSAAGHPLLGDRKYGNSESERISLVKEINTVALCACRLSFVHPTGGKNMDFLINREDLPKWCKRVILK